VPTQELLVTRLGGSPELANQVSLEAEFWERLTSASIQPHGPLFTCTAVYSIGSLIGKEPMIDLERFGETVAVNRGAIGKVFTDVDEAVAWLEQIVKLGYRGKIL